MMNQFYTYQKTFFYILNVKQLCKQYITSLSLSDTKYIVATPLCSVYSINKIKLNDVGFWKKKIDMEAMIFWLEYTTYTFGESFALMLKKKILDKQS